MHPWEQYLPPAGDHQSQIQARLQRTHTSHERGAPQASFVNQLSIISPQSQLVCDSCTQGVDSSHNFTVGGSSRGYPIHTPAEHEQSERNQSPTDQSLKLDVDQSKHLEKQ